MNIFRLYCLCTFIALCSWSSVTFAQIVEIPDPNLERAIREKLGLPSHLPLTQKDMLRLTGFAAEDAGIENITGLEYAHNLRSLFLRNNPIKDLTPLVNLTQLELLHLIGVPMEDVTFLKNLTKLRELYLAYCQITDITPIQNLTQLVLLDLSVNRIMDVSPLANLTALRTLWIDRNRIVDFSPLLGLSLTDFRYDEVCVIPDPPIRDRISNRNLPSIIQGWDNEILNLPALSYQDRLVYHDLIWSDFLFNLRFRQSPPWSQLIGDVKYAIAEREELLAKNPNMIFLREIRLHTANPSHYSEDWPYWVRDADGNRISGDRVLANQYLVDYRLREAQDMLVQQAISAARCGLYDGIIFDVWSEVLVLIQDPGMPTYQEHTPEYAQEVEIERTARTSILRRIREAVPDDFLILCNSNWYKLPFSAPYINGGFMETFRDLDTGYSDARLAAIEDALLWYEANVRSPQVNILRAEGIPTEPPDSPNNRRWMRFFTTMSFIFSDGYVLYTIGGHSHRHYWYSFWDTDIGQPIGSTTQPHENIEGLYVREFTNGWAVYNRSGTAQTISLPQSVTGVSSGKHGITHILPDLDGEMYLKAPNPTDVNGDGKVNVLDLVQVANGLGQSAPDPNGDGVVNILDLVFVAQQFSQ